MGMQQNLQGGIVQWHIILFARIAGATLTPEKPATANERSSRSRAKRKRLREAVKPLEATLRQQAERYLCTEIEPSEWDKAKAYAEQKLKGIIEREGDGDGARRQPWYLAQLIAETVRGSRFSKFTLDLMEIFSSTDDMGVKKGQPVS